MNDKTKDPLARWWWPGQWLHIVYAVWIDQLWYWKNVRPQLYGRNLGWGLYAQGMLGAVVIGLIVVTILGGIFLAIGIQIRWDLLVLGIAGVSLGSAVIGTIQAVLNNDLPANVAKTIAVCTVAGVPVSLVVGTNLTMNANVSSALWGALFGAALGVGVGVVRGDIFMKDRDLFLAILISLYFVTKEGLAVGVILLSTLVLGFYCGGRWAIRQIQDAKTRRHLANPYATQDFNGGYDD